MAMKKRKKASTADAAEKCCVSEPYIEPENKRSGWKEWEITDALRTLAKAKKIRGNTAFMKAIRAEAQRQVEVAKSTASQL